MVAKRFLALAMAGLLTVTSFNTGSLKVYAQEAEQAALESSSVEEAGEELPEVQESAPDNEEVIAEENGDAENAETVSPSEEEEAQAGADDAELIDDAIGEETAEETTEETAGTDASGEGDLDTVEVTFSAVGGVFLNEEDTLILEVSKGTVISDDIEVPDREGFIFDGWFLDEEYTQPVDLSTFAFTENAVLYARWQESADGDAESEDLLGASDFEFTLNANGGKFPNGETTYKRTYATRYLTNDSEKPEQEGKIFIGWFSEPECTNLLSQKNNFYYLQKEPENGDILYAGWGDYYTITYVFGAESGDDPAISGGYYWDYKNKSRSKTLEYKVPKGQTLNNYQPDSSYVRNTDLHYTRTSWYTDEARTQKISSMYSFTPKSNMSIYAGFEKNRKVLTVNVNDNDAYFEYEDLEHNEIKGKFKKGFKQTYTYDSYNKGYSTYFYTGYLKNTNPKMAYAGIYSDQKCSDEKLISNNSSYFYLEDDLEVWVKWVPTNKVVTFDPNGGYFRSWDSDTDKYIISMDPVEIGTDGEEHWFSPGTVKRDDLHYRFAGWSTNKNATVADEGLSTDDDDGSFSFNATFTADTKLYAVWSKEYNVATFKAGEGKIKHWDSDADEYKMVDSYTTRIEENGRPDDYPSDSYVYPNNKSQIFDAWYVGNTRVDSIYSYTCDGDTTFVAKYATKYTITLDAQGGYFKEWNSDKQDYDHLPTRELEVAKGNSEYLDTPYTDEDKEFGGWYTDTELKNPVPNNYLATGNITLYARWLSKFTVTLNCGDGKINGQASVSQKVTEGQPISSKFSAIASPVPNDENKAFEGWYTDAELKNRIEKSDILATQVDKDINFYAKYVQAYTVTFDAGTGSFRSKEGKTYTVKVAEGKSVGSMVPTMISTERNVFEGWFKESGDSGEEIRNVYAYPINKNTTFYAHYTECYIITFHANKKGALVDGKETVKVQIVKGTAIRYGKDTDQKDKLYEAPTLDYSGVDLTKALPFIYEYGDHTYGWSTEKDGSGGTYYFGDSGHSYYSAEGNYRSFNMYGFVPTKDMDFYVRWGEPVKVTFDPNGGTFKTGSSYDKYGTLNLKGQRELMVPSGIFYTNVREPSSDAANPPAGKDVNYASWGYDKDGQYIGSYTKITEDTLVYARWYKSSGSGGSGSTKKTVTLHAMEGYFWSVSTKVDTFTYSSLSTSSRHYVSIPNIADKDKAFKGWYYDEECKRPYPAEYQDYDGSSYYVIVPKDITDLYAAYGPAFTVKFDANGGYFDQDSDRTKDPNEDMRDATAISVKQKVSGREISFDDYVRRIRRDGDKVFGGWYADAEGNTKVVTETVDSSDEYYTPTQNCTLYAGWDEYALPDEITIQADETIMTGQTIDIKATISPATFDRSDLKWYISGVSWPTKDNPTGIRPGVLTSEGKFIGQAAGTVSLYAELNGRLSNVISIKITNGTVPQSISLDKSSVNLVKNGTATITATVTPSTDASKVKWTSNNEKVATVDGSGSVAVITAGDTEGTATITAKLGSQTAKVTVNVSVPIRLDKNTASLTYREGNTLTLAAAVADSYKDSAVVWTTSDPDTLTVTSSGKTGAEVKVKGGKDLTEAKEVTITATIDGTEYADKCVITVRPVGTADAPTADVQPGKVNAGTVVNLTSATPDAKIYFTMAKGSAVPADPQLVNRDPAEGTTLYTDAFVIDEDVTIKAVAYNDGLNVSKVSTFAYTVNNDDWGADIEGESDVLKSFIKDHFGNKVSAVPDDIWFVLKDKEGYEYKDLKSDTNTKVVKTYTGSKVTFDNEIVVYYNTRRLSENRDYTVTYANNILAADTNAAKAPTFTIKGKGQFNSQIQFRFTIDKVDINEAEITSEKTVTVIAGSAKLGATKPVVTFAGKKLALNKDYVLNYYKGSEAVAANLIADPAKEVIKDTTTVYTIEVAASESGCFIEKMAETVTVMPILKAANIVQASKLKVGDAKGKAITVKYDGNKVDVAELFDNTEGKTPVAFVKSGKTDLVYGTDFTVVEDSDDDYSSAGTHTFIIRGLDKSEASPETIRYAGDKTATLTIEGTLLNKAKIAGLKTAVEYTGKPITLTDLYNPADKTCVAEKWNGVTLYTVNNKVKTPVTDYEVSFINNTGAVGKFDVVFTGKDSASGSLKKTITVKAHTLKGDDFNVSAADATFTKAGAKPAVTVTFKGATLREGVDYTVTYKNNAQVAAKDAAKAPTATVKGIGNFKGSGASATFSITKADVSKAVKVTVNDVIYNAAKSGKTGYFLAVPKLFDGGKAVTAGKNKDIDAIAKGAYKYTYKFDTKLGSGATRSAGDTVLATDKVLGGTIIEVSVPVTISNTKSPYKADTTEITGTYKVIDKANDISKFAVSVSEEGKKKLSFYNGEEIRFTKSDLVVGMKSGKSIVPIDSSNYEIVSVTGNRFLGTASITIAGKGIYGGTKTIKVKITAKSF